MWREEGASHRVKAFRSGMWVQSALGGLRQEVVLWLWLGVVPASFGQSVAVFRTPGASPEGHKPHLCSCAGCYFAFSFVHQNMKLFSKPNFISQSCCPSTTVAVVTLGKVFPCMIFQSFHSWFFPNHPDLRIKVRQAEPLSFD